MLTQSSSTSAQNMSGYSSNDYKVSQNDIGIETGTINGAFKEILIFFSNSSAWTVKQ